MNRPISRWTRPLFAAVATILFIALVEVGFRAAYRLIEGERAATELGRYSHSGASGMANNFRADPDCLYVYDSSRPGVDESGFLAPIPKGDKKTGELRIAALGDSTAAGEHAWPARLHRMLLASGRAALVANLAVPGYTSLEGLGALRKMGPIVKPDIVIAGFGFNDLQAGMFAGFQSDYTHFRKAFTTPKVRLADALDRFMTDSSRFYAFARRRLGFPPIVGYQLEDYLLTPNAEPKVPPDFDPRFRDAFRGNLSSMTQEAEKLGAKIIFSTTPWCASKCPEGSRNAIRRGLDATNSVIREFAGTHVIDLDAAISGRSELFADHIHALPEGDETCARIIFDSLADLR